MNFSNIVVFVGHFGSGKTEMAINYAINASKSNKSTVLIDLDIVNPFFRSSEVKDILHSNNIELISPNFVGTTSDVPSLPAKIQGVFEKTKSVVVFDVGGDKDGATALGRYKAYFDKAGYDMFFVVNTRRPLTATANDILEYMEEIESHSRLKITGLISNTNLSYETTVPIIEEGIDIVREVSKKSNIPIKFISVPENLLDTFPINKYQEAIFPLELYMTRWHQQ